MVINLMFIPPGYSTGFSQENADPDIDRAYTVLQEAYQARQEGDETLAREKMARALALFRQTAAENVPGLVRPETEYILEETPRNINLIENKILFKLEFKNDPAARNRIAQHQEELVRQQQLILQKLILLTRENTELKKSISQVASDTKEIGNISDTVSDIQDDTGEIAELDSRLDDIENTTDDTLDAVENQSNGRDIADNVEDVADDVADIRDDMDLLKDILNIVEDIKDDTSDIKDVGDKVDDVKDVVEDGQ